MIAVERASHQAHRAYTSRDRLTVAMLIHRFHPYVGGAEVQLKALLPHLRDRGIDVRVITRAEPGAPTHDVVDGAPVYRVPIPRSRGAGSLGYTLGALRELSRHRDTVQLIHSHGLLSPSTTATAARLLLNVPGVVTTHGFQADLALLRDGVLGLQRFRAIGSVMDRFVVISEEIRQGLCAHGVPAHKLVRIPNGIDTDRFAPLDSARRERLREVLEVTGKRVVVYVGRIEGVKGPDVLLDAWPAVRQHVPDALLLMAGDGVLRPSLESRRIPGVRFLGSVADPLPLYQAADTFVLPSRSEGLPVALLEALCVGLPVLSTRVGGAPQILDCFESRTLVPPDDANALADRLIHCLADPPDTLQRAALQRRVSEEYSIRTTAERLSALYRELARERVTA